MFLHPSQTTGRWLMERQLAGPVDMLNLLQFRDEADYTGSPELAPSTPITGPEAYRLYTAHVLPLLTAAGGQLIYMGHGGPWFIGPEAERWDMVLLVRHQSVQAFMQFASNPTYLAGAGHRTAALADSRLLPLVGPA